MLSYIYIDIHSKTNIVTWNVEIQIHFVKILIKKYRETISLIELKRNCKILQFSGPRAVCYLFAFVFPCCSNSYFLWKFIHTRWIACMYVYRRKGKWAIEEWMEISDQNYKIWRKKRIASLSPTPRQFTESFAEPPIEYQ